MEEFESDDRDNGQTKNHRDPQKIEIIGGGGDSRNWRSIIISVAVILFIFSLIAIAVYIVMPEFILSSDFLFDDIFNETFQPNHYDLQWLSGSKYVHKDAYKNVAWNELDTGESGILITNRTMDEEEASEFWVNPDMTYVLLACRVKKLYRHSFFAEYKIYDVQTMTLFGVTAPGMKELVDFRYAGWGPIGTSLVYVYKNNLYYVDSLPTEKTKLLDKAVQVTQSGVEELVFHGVPDWVYEEELLSSNSAIYWCKDGTRLVFASFNDTEVKLAWYAEYKNLPYSLLEQYAYPKAGYSNPTFKLQVLNPADADNLVVLQPPAVISKNDYYYRHVVWVDSDRVAVVWLNRPQNISVLTLCPVDTGVCTVIHNLRTPGGWVVDRGPPMFSTRPNYVRILPQREGTFGNYFHIALIETTVLDKVTFLTRGRWEVTAIVAYRPTVNLVYYMSTERSMHGRHLYSVSTEPPYVQRCLSCGLHPNCTYYEALFNPEGTWYRLNCLGFGVPRTTLQHTDTGRVVVVETNEHVHRAIAGKDQLNKTILNVPVNNGEYVIPVQLLKPQPMDQNRKHPILVNIYGGPGSQMVDDRFALGWNAYISSKHHVITVNIDGRGTGFQGDRHMYQVYRRLGALEVQDIAIAVKYILRDLDVPYLNTTKVGIWGWSYGGFLASMALGAGDGLFQYAVAVAPVTDFRYYDSIYTERYMGMPESVDNLDGYKQTNVSAKVKNFKGRNFFLVHGTADNNVHFQNSADLVRALVEEEVPHRTQFYTDQTHALDNPHVKRHFYSAMSEFVDNSIQKTYKTEL